MAENLTRGLHIVYGLSNGERSLVDITAQALSPLEFICLLKFKN